jgi:hypothetical protein
MLSFKRLLAVTQKHVVANSVDKSLLNFTFELKVVTEIEPLLLYQINKTHFTCVDQLLG